MFRRIVWNNINRKKLNNKIWRNHKKKVWNHITKKIINRKMSNFKNNHLNKKKLSMMLYKKKVLKTLYKIV